MRLVWYNRDEISDEDMRQAKVVANRLLGRKEVVFPFGWEPAPQWAKDAKEDDRKREAK